MTVLTFALTVHETQGQTLRRIILLLGRLPGMNVGKITWSLIYVALSRTKKMEHMKLFPTGSTDYYHSMYFRHLLKLSMPTNLKKWYRSYSNHSWDRNVLRKEHLVNVRKVEKRLKHLGSDKTKLLGWEDLYALVKQMGYKATTKTRKFELFNILKEHMMKRCIWKSSRDCSTSDKKSNKRCKRPALMMEVESSSKPTLLLPPSKRLREHTSSKSDKDLSRRKSIRTRSSRKRKSTGLELHFSTPRHAENLRIEKKKQSLTSCGKSKENILARQPSRLRYIRFKELQNLGQTCYFNCIVQCLFHCPLVKNIIENLPQHVLSVAVLRQLQLLFNRMASRRNLTYVSPSRCFSAAMKIPECSRAHMNKDDQEDANEFFLMLVEYLDQEFQLLANLFQGTLRSTVSCQRCFRSYIKVQSFKLLSLSFPDNVHQTHDIYDLMDDYVTPELISGYNCNSCAGRYPAEKTLNILSTPKVLTVQLKRFSGLQKNKDHVRFPSQLRVKYVSADNDEFHFYRITGVVVHQGTTIRVGHYVAYVLAGDQWLEANDQSIREVSWEYVSTKQVYLLFYVRL